MKNILDELKKCSDEILPLYRELLLKQLNDKEKTAFLYTESLNFKDGSWYRPIHNIIIPLSMKVILNTNGNLNNDLMYAAILHDIGYAGINVKGTLEGADWEKKDKRESHMLIGAKMAKVFFDENNLTNRNSVNSICEIIGEHDNPYIGMVFSNNESIYVRDADLSFVPSTVSFYKDYIAKSAKDKLCLESFLYERLLNFYNSFKNIPLIIQKFICENKFNSLDKNSLHLEKCKTDSGKEITDFFLTQRTIEVFNNKEIDIKTFKASLNEELNLFKNLLKA